MTSITQGRRTPAWSNAQRRNERDDVLRLPKLTRLSAPAPLRGGVPTLLLVAAIVALAAWSADAVSLESLASGAASLASSVAAFIGQAPF